MYKKENGKGMIDEWIFELQKYPQVLLPRIIDKHFITIDTPRKISIDV